MKVHHSNLISFMKSRINSVIRRHFYGCSDFCTALRSVTEIMTSQNTKGGAAFLTIYYMKDYEVRGLSGKVSSHFEYIENRSRGLDVTWQQVRGDLTARP